MTESNKKYLKVILASAIVFGIFQPYAYKVIPIEILYEISFEGFYLSDIAQMVHVLSPIILLVLILVRSKLKKTISLIVAIVLIVLYLTVLTNFVYGHYTLLYNTYFEYNIIEWIWIYLDLFIILGLSSAMFLYSFKLKLSISEKLENIVIATLTIPVLNNFSVYLEKLQYGSYLITISFTALYFISVNSFYKFYKRKRKGFTKETNA